VNWHRSPAIRLAGQSLLVAFLAALPYLQVLDAPFVFDDLKLVRDNEEIRDLSRLPAAFNVFSKEWDQREVRANYRPVRFLSYAIDYRISRWLYGGFAPESLPPRVFHSHNVLLHALNALLLLAIGRILLDRRSALFLALLFALHPLATEAVTYVSGRRDVLSTFFFLSALWIYLKSFRPALILVPVLFILGLLSKEMVVTLPAVCLLVDLARGTRPSGSRVVLLGTLFALAFGFAAFEARKPDLVAGTVGGSFGSTLLTAPRYVARYLALALFPYPQSLDYSFDAIPASSGLIRPWTTLPLLLLWLILAGAGLWALARRRTAPATGLLWFLGTLLPVLQLVPIPERFAERFLYLPAIGVFLFLAGLFRTLAARSPRVAWGGAAALLALLGAGTLARNRDWLTPLDLWGSAARAQPRCARAHLGHGHALRDAGRLRDAAAEYSRALEVLETAGLSAPPGPEARADDPLIWGNLIQARTFRAQCWAELGSENSEYFRKAADEYHWLLGQSDIDGTPIGGSPRYVMLRHQLGSCLLGLSQAERSTERARELRGAAAEEFRRVAAEEESQPGLARSARYYLSRFALAEGRADDGLREMEEAFRIARRSGDALDRYRLAGELADLRIGRKEYDQADDFLKESISELGSRAERKHLFYRRALIADRKGDLVAAARLLEDSLALDPDYGPALLTLGGLEEGRGNLDRAEELYRRLLSTTPGEPRALRGLKGVKVRRDLAKAQPGASEGAGSEVVVLKGLIARGEGHLAKGEYLAAVEPFLRAAGTPVKEGESAEDRGLRGLALRRLAAIERIFHRYSQAEEYLSAAIAADPAGRDALRDLADLQVRYLKDHRAAIHTYQEYLDGFPAGQMAEGRVYLNLGSLLKESDPARAVELYRSAEKAGCRDAALYRSLGYLLATLGRWEDSLSAFQEYLEQDEAAPAGGAGTGAGAAKAQKDRVEVRRFLDEQVLPKVQGGEGLRGEPEAR
jgi:tetratricopeptide (TPR) repeat protein